MCEIHINTLFSISGKGVDSYQLALCVVVPMLIFIIITVVALYIKKHHPQILKKPIKANESGHFWENLDGKSVTKPGSKAQDNASESVYDEIDAKHIDVSTNVYV